MEAAAAERRQPEEEAARYPQARKPQPVAAEEEKQKEEKEKEEEEESPLAKRRRVLCSEFTAITSSDAAVARSFLASNDWHIEVRLARGLGWAAPTAVPSFPVIYLCVSEGAERLLRAADGEGG